MAEGENEDELFEDLDKFFAPIQDVDWPETESTPARAPGGRPPAEAGRTPADETTPADDEDERVETTEMPAVEASSDDDADDDDEDVEDEGLEDEGDDLSVEAFTQPPAAYVDLPGGADTDVAELEEDRFVPEEPPSEQQVEAAAEHFAESVRDEVEIQPSEGEPAGLADLLGESEDEEDEDEDLELQEAPPVRTVRVGAEGLGGPSWQEPTVLEVGPDHDRRPSGRDLPLAFLTGLALAALAIGAIAIGAGAFAIFAAIVVLIAQGEFYFALQKHHHQPATALGLVSGGLVLGAAYYREEAAMLAVFALSIFATFLWFLTTPEQHRRGVLTNIALTVLGIAYVPLLAGYALAALRFSDGRGIVLSIIGLTVVYDTAAFVFGTWWGSKPLAPTTSPKKSIEGLVAATLATILVGIAIVPSATSVLDTFGRAAALGVVVAVFAPLGDLAESLLKRDLDVKDIGSILPGHGGVLDRIDSLLFVAPAAFVLLRLILL